MNYRMWLLGLLLCASQLSASSTRFGDGDAFRGGYIGGNGGLTKNMAETSIFSDVLTDENLSETYEADNNVCQIRPWGEVFGGWGWQICWLYLGARVGVSFSEFDPKADFKAEVVTPGVIVDQQRNSLRTELNLVEYTADFRPGVVFYNNTMLYGLIGGAYNKQRLRGIARYAFSDIPPGDTGMDEIKVVLRRCSTAFRAGLGIEHLIMRCLGINLTYVYTHYWKLKGGDVNDSPSASQSFEAFFNTQATKQVISMGLAYYF